ncbi:hypothetical protein VKT23_014416 [Stygiomarasmius scandens]|uniref:Uncharacterized protein n=1 Tax=Marasmiellus scandens TaxID=2682957 RepID=A0ABR1J0J2_9AGAR
MVLGFKMFRSSEVSSSEDPPTYQTYSYDPAGSRFLPLFRPNKPHSEDEDETRPLLGQRKPSAACTICRKLIEVVSVVLTLSSAVAIILYLYLHKSPLTSSWIDITPSQTCHGIGTRDYTATLVNIPEDWNPLQACHKTVLVIRDKEVSSPRVCTYEPTVGGDIIVRGKWTVNLGDGDCMPVWSPISLEDCVAWGVRRYHSDLEYVPLGLDDLASCRAMPVTIHDRSVLPTRCRLLSEDDDTQMNGTVVARGEWDIDFQEKGCVPSWTPTVAQECTSFGTRHHYADLLVPIGLEKSALALCRYVPASIHDWNVFPKFCEQLGDGVIRGHWNVGFSEPSCEPTWETDVIGDKCLSYGIRRYYADLLMHDLKNVPTLCQRIPAIIHGQKVFPKYCEDRVGGITRAYWDIDFSEPSCKPTWKEVQAAEHCHAYSMKRYTAILSGIPEELDALKTCYEVPLRFGSEVEAKPESCDRDDQNRIVGTWFMGTPECEPILKDVVDYGCITSESGFKRIEGEVVNINERDNWYRMCTTVPYQYQGEIYLPVQCENRPFRSTTRKFALYNIPSARCVSKPIT